MTAIENIVVVGASLAGLRCIEALRREGFDGRITALSAEPHMPYDRPPLSKQFLKGEWGPDRIRLQRQGDEDLRVDWRLGCRAEALLAEEKCVVIEGGERIAYDGLVIATGSRPRRLPFGHQLAGVHTLRSLDDANALREDLARAARLVVIGGGFIGMEVAASARELEIEVTVVEPLEAPLLRGIGPELGRYMAERHREKGVDVRCGVGVAGIEGNARVEAVELTDGTKLKADVVLVGIGIEPVCDWLNGSGLEIDDGIVCDARGATQLSGVVAVGDVARWANPLLPEPRRYEHWTSAVQQAGPAAQCLLQDADATPPLAQVPYVWSDQYEHRLAMAGDVTGADAMAVCHGTLEEGRCLVLFGRNGRLVAAVAFRRPRQLHAASDLIAEGAAFDDAVAAQG